MSILFSKLNIGNVPMRNRFVHSATYEAMALPTGEVTEKLIKRYRKLAKNEVGLIIPGYMFVDASGKAVPLQVGIHNEAMIPGLKKLTDAVHQEGGKIFFQLMHAGRQTLQSIIGRQPMGPSDNGRDPQYFVKARVITEPEIHELIKAFGDAARRAVAAGADGIQLHAAHGYLIDQFLSPFFNFRKDQWGGSDENRFRFLREVIIESRKNMPKGMPLIIKLNTNDHTPKEGITPALATKYARWLYELGIDGIEVSAGTIFYSVFNMSRGEVPVEELVLGMPWWKKPLGRMALKSISGKFDLVEGYNVEAGKMVKSVIDGIPLLTVGGLRRLSYMQEAVEKGYTDFVSLSRPLIREPKLVLDFNEGRKEKAACESCNKCLAAITLNLPLRCYTHGFKSRDETED
jgi:2,4-dienoyl-CoA reductase-like NADH-dependent reductase (Old Yellow Enzyme family)